MNATIITETPPAIAFRLCQPHGSFYVPRHNERLWCAHGEVIWSEPRDERGGVRAAAIRRQEAAAALRARTGCLCRWEGEESE